MALDSWKTGKCRVKARMFLLRRSLSSKNFLKFTLSNRSGLLPRTYLPFFQQIKFCSTWTSLKEKADNNDVEAQYQLALLYLKGKNRNDQLALEYCQKAAKNGNVDAKLVLAQYYRHVKDHTKALELLDEAQKSGSKNAAVNFYYHYKQGQGVEQNEEKAKEYLEEGVRNKDGEALVIKAMLCMEAENSEQPKALREAREYLEQACEVDYSPAYSNKATVQMWLEDLEGAKQTLLYAANEKNHATSQLMLGKQYFKENDFELGTKYLEKAIASDEDIAFDAMYFLGENLFNGRTGVADKERAIELLKKAAGFDHFDSIRALSSIYFQNGQEEEALALLRRGSELEDPIAQYDLGLYYFQSSDPEQKRKGLDYLMSSAKKGYARAQFSVGKWALEGAIQVDKELAVQFLESAAHTDKLACFYLGNFYENGKYVDKDLKKAFHYYREGAAFEDSNSLFALACFYLYKEEFKNVETGISILVDLSKKKYSNAMFTMAECYGAGLGVPKDAELAKQWKKQAYVFRANELYSLGKQYYDHQEYKRALDCFKESADLHYPDAQFLLGRLFIEQNEQLAGLGTREDGVKYLQFAAKNGHPAAQFMLGQIYWEGKLLPADIGKAFALFEQSAEKYPESVYCLSLFYLNGIHVEQDFQKATSYLEKAVSLGNAGAHYDLANCYLFGEANIQPDEKRGIELLEKSASLGWPPALVSIALRYQSGTGVPENMEKALEYINKAVALGDIDAICTLGCWHIYGLVPSFDPSKGISLLEQAASSNHVEATFQLGVLFHEGLHFTKNPEKATEFFVKAADLGHEGAKTLLSSKE